MFRVRSFRAISITINTMLPAGYHAQELHGWCTTKPSVLLSSFLRLHGTCTRGTLTSNNIFLVNSGFPGLKSQKRVTFCFLLFPHTVGAAIVGLYY